LVQELREGRKTPPAPAKDPDIRRLEEDLSSRFGTLVVIRHGKKGSGQVVIEYDSLDQLEGVLERLQ
jgi:ParB family chromosome partitioning protein